MSASMVRRGLELLSNDIKSDMRGKKKKKPPTPSSATARALVSTKRQGVTRQVKRLQGRLGPGKSKATVKDKRIKCVVEVFRKKQRKSLMKQNLKFLMRDGFKAKMSDTLKIQNYNTGRQSCNPLHEDPQKPEDTPVFTEEEFENFQREYFGANNKL